MPPIFNKANHDISKQERLNIRIENMKESRYLGPERKPEEVINGIAIEVLELTGNNNPSEALIRYAEHAIELLILHVSKFPSESFI